MTVFGRIEASFARESAEMRKHAELQDAAIVELKKGVEDLSKQIAKGLLPELSVEKVTDCLRATAEVGARCVALETRLEGLEGLYQKSRLPEVGQRLESCNAQLAELHSAQSWIETAIRELQKRSEVVLKMQSHKMTSFADHLKDLDSEVTALRSTQPRRRSVGVTTMRELHMLAKEYDRFGACTDAFGGSSSEATSPMELSSPSFGLDLSPQESRFKMAPGQCGDQDTPTTTTSSGHGSVRSR